MPKSGIQKGFAPLIILAIFALIGAGGAGVVVASDSANPGDPLYPVDTAIEQIRLTLTGNPEAEARLRAGLAEERLEEANELIIKYGDDSPQAEEALEDFLEHVGRLDNSDEFEGERDRIQQLFQERERIMEQYFESQQEMLESTRELIKKQLEEAIRSGNTELVTSLRSRLAGLETQLDNLEDQEEDEQREFESDKESQSSTSESGSDRDDDSDHESDDSNDSSDDSSDDSRDEDEHEEEDTETPEPASHEDEED